MNRVPIVIEQAAKSDIRSARDYYSDRGENTSERFRDELAQVFDLPSQASRAAEILPQRLDEFELGNTSFA